MRFSRQTRAVAATLLASSLFMSGSTAVSAQEVPTPRPVITSAPRIVGFEKRAVIHGRLDDGRPGDTVALQQRLADVEWRTVAEKPVDEDVTVRFARAKMRRTTAYRLVHSDEVAAETTTSERVKVKVRPLLKIALSHRHVYKGRDVRVHGRLRPARPGRKVVIHKKVAGEWRFVKRVRVGRRGYYSARVTAKPIGHRKVRVLFKGDADSVRSARNRQMKVYRRDLATWYGPGFYGNRTACGRTLTSSTLGVAHRTLPCGTGVSVLYNGRSITVPVIDRGPYTSANWDLTRETARRLGFSGKQHIGVTR